MSVNIISDFCFVDRRKWITFDSLKQPRQAVNAFLYEEEGEEDGEKEEEK